MLRRFALYGFLVVLSGWPSDGFGEGEERQAATTAPSFSERLIADRYGYAYGVTAADIDGDGDLDLTSQDIVGSTPARAEPTFSSLSWYENDGGGRFQRHFIHRNEPGWLERHAVGDIDGDARPDIVVVNNRDGHILWFPNGSQPREAWKRQVVSTQCARAYDVVLSDLDGDGDLDVAAAGYISGRITWFENPGRDGWDREWRQNLIDEAMPEARTICTGDFNRDGRTDLLAAAVGADNVPPDVADARQHGSSIAWYENAGPLTKPSWKKHLIDDRARAPIHGHPADLDGDGDLDVVMAHGMRESLAPEERHEIAWYENLGAPGTGLEWKRHTIGGLKSAFEAVPADLDADGDIDMVATAWSHGDRLVWFENHGDPRGGWTMHVIRPVWRAANQVIVADLDGDRRPDIIATADNGSKRIEYRGANELRWWRNEGTAPARRE